MDDADPATLVPTLRRDPEELDGFLEFLAAEIAHPGLGGGRRLVPARPTEIRSALRLPLPATGLDGHHGYAGGLLEHIVGVATICREIAELHPRLRRKSCSPGRFCTTSPDPRARTSSFVSPDRGRSAARPCPSGMRLIEERSRDLDPAVLAELLHAIATHHDRPAARTAEAAVLYHANQLDAQAATRPVGDGPTLFP